MSDTPEARVKKRIRELLAGVLYRQPTTGGYGSSGQLDFTVCVNGHYLGIEAKSVESSYGKRGPTALQWDEIDAIRKAGGVAMVADEDNLGDVKTVVDALQCDAVHIAKRLSWKSTDRFDRPGKTIADEPQPTVRKRAKKEK